MANKFRKVTAVCTAALFTLGTGTLLFSDAQDDALCATAAVDDTNDDWLHCEGDKIYDMYGNEVWLTGANWFGFNCSENCAHGLYAADVDVFLSNVADKGINIIRFPISTELLYSWMNDTPNPVSSVQAGYEPPVDQIGEDGSITPAGYYVNINKDFVLEDGKTLKNSMEIFDVIMQKCKKYGIKAMIDIHSPHSDNSGHNYELWYGKEAADGTMMTTEIWIDTLVWLADKYKNDDTIIGLDLKNEPHGKRDYDATCPTNMAKWDDSTDENNWAYAATRCGKAILDANPNLLIFIEGTEQYPKTELGYTFDTPNIFGASAEASPWYPAWWGGNLRGVRDYPIDLGSDAYNAQIVYSPHDYGPSVFNQTWFDKDFTTQTLLDDYWYDTWAYIDAEGIAPLLIGEWGGHMDGDKNQKWMELLRDYMIENRINHTFWCLNPNSGDTGGLLGYDFVTWDSEKYALFEPSLWQDADGKYIGLDHQVVLGSNGTNVTEYYGGTITTTPPTTTTTTGTGDTTTTTTVTTTKTGTSNTLYGDVNLDSSVTISDVVLLARYISQDSEISVEPQGLINADCVADGTIDSSDLTLIARYIGHLVDTIVPSNE